MNRITSTILRFLRAGSIAIALGAFAACASSTERNTEAFTVTGFSLVLLVTGESNDASTEKLSQQHFAFMKRIASEGKLLLAGPFGPDKHRADLEGIFLIDESDADRAREIAGEDPTTLAGVFNQEVIPITTLDVVRYLPDVEKLRQERRLANGESLDQPDVRAYTVLTCRDGTTAAKEVFSNPAIGEVVVLMARMEAPREDELFAILDVPTAFEARARLKVANQSGLTINVSEWYSSPALAELVQGGGPPPEITGAKAP